MWVMQSDINDGNVVHVPTAEAQRLRELELEAREPRRAVEIHERAAPFLRRELNRLHRQ
jgi:hypothetical protein